MEDKKATIIGFDAQAYALRAKGYSPEPIREAVWDIVKEKLGGVVLDVGSGSGEWIEWLQKSSNIKKIISIDIVDDGASQIESVEFHLVDASQQPLPLVSESVDWVFALEVLEHLANPRYFVKETARVLRSGGKLVITTPCNDSLTAKLSFLFRGYFPAFCDHDYQESGHITPITELDIQRISIEAGYKDLKVYYPLPGRIPKSSVYWQKVFPFLRGKLWSDSLIAVFTM